MSDWIEIPQTEVGRQTEKAIELIFPNGVAAFTERRVWVPKSCYATETRGAFVIQLVKRWFYFRNKLQELCR